MASDTCFFDKTFGFNASLDAHALLGVEWLFALVAFSSGNTSRAFLAASLTFLGLFVPELGSLTGDTLGS